MQTLSKKSKMPGSVIILLQLFDVILHVALGMPEPLRILANIIIVGWVGATLAGWLKDKFQPTALGTIGAYLLLNIVFLFTQNFLTTQEIAFMFVVFIFPTLGLSAWLTFRTPVSAE